MTDAGDINRMRRIIARLKSYGVQVREIPGWEQRGATFPIVPMIGVDHHDASSRKSGEWGALGVIIEGRPGIPGPLSQFQVARCLDGVPKVAVVAAGRANHAGKGGSLLGVPKDSANSRSYGQEKANDGLSEPYTPAALYAARALLHACAVESGREPATFPVGHNEWAAGRLDGDTAKAIGRKSDPTYNMNTMRAKVTAFTATEEGDMTIEDVRVALHSLLKEAAERSTPTGRQVGDYLAQMLVSPVASQVWSAMFGPADNRVSAGEMLAEARRDAAATLVALQESAVQTPGGVDAASLAAALAPALIEALGDRTALSQQDVEDAMRRVLGSLDE